MAPLRLNPNKLALALHVPAPTVCDIVHEERGISPEMALRLGRFFQTTPDFWLNLQSEFDLRVVRRQKEATVKRQVRPLDESAWVSGLPEGRQVAGPLSRAMIFQARKSKPRPFETREGSATRKT
jgi:antitoxin HigA-1